MILVPNIYLAREERPKNLFLLSIDWPLLYLKHRIIEKVNQFRYLALVSADIIDKAVKSHDYYHAKFAANQEEDVLLHNTLHRNGMGLGEPVNEHWLVEAQRTGEFFPRRPQVRLRMNFGTRAKKEKWPLIQEKLHSFG